MTFKDMQIITNIIIFQQIPLQDTIYIYIYKTPSYYCIDIAVVHLLILVQLFVTPWTATCQASLSFSIPPSLFKLMSFESVMPSSHLILCYPLLTQPSIFPSTGVFSSESALCPRWPSTGVLASASVLPMNIQSWFPWRLTGLIFLQSKGLKSLLQHHSSKASILQCSTFFMVQLSNPYMTTGKKT